MKLISLENALIEQFGVSEGIRIWTGHLDSFYIAISDNEVFVVDFKPERDLDSKNPGSHFINIMPQLIGYSLIVQSIIAEDGLDIRSVAFNEDGQAVEFNPNEILPLIELFMKGKFDHTGVNQEILQEYQLGMKPHQIYIDFFKDFKQLLKKPKS
ncbi:MAG: hypothetical protein GF311_20210 [Candidatus Lokiarchaeota archaeon]|nr:hypothetical protein [Candidatus Lokiarchaeota archaeon]